MISRVIGRGGCNINAIRECTGAHIDIDKQKDKTGDRIITIRWVSRILHWLCPVGIFSFYKVGLHRKIKGLIWLFLGRSLESRGDEGSGEAVQAPAGTQDSL